MRHGKDDARGGWRQPFRGTAGAVFLNGMRYYNSALLRIKIKRPHILNPVATLPESIEV
jgi:hypothetical protein